MPLDIAAKATNLLNMTQIYPGFSGVDIRAGSQFVLTVRQQF